MSNYPDGMRSSDLPGWFDMDCPECEGTGVVDQDGEEMNCPYCDGTGIVDSREYEKRVRDEHYADRSDYE